MKKNKKCIVVFFLIIVFSAQLVFGSENKPKKIVLGQSSIVVSKHALIGTQIDRVIRDIAWENSDYDINSNPFKIPKKEQLVPYMEGRLSALLMDFAEAKIIGLTPALAVLKEDGQYYADNGQNEYVFAIEPGKTEYKSSLFSSDKKKGMFLDTHGFNMIAGEAVRLNEIANFGLVIACLDMPAKARAARFLAKKGINCFGPCDRFAYDLIGYKELDPTAATIIGTAPIRAYGDGAIIGNQVVEISLDEVIVTQNTFAAYPDQYCDTPTRYFKQINKLYGLKLQLLQAEAGAGEAQKVVEVAEKAKASVIGVRVWNEADAKAVSAWLEKNLKHRAILFHSAIYEPGYEMFFRYPKQTGFGDLSPKFY